MKAYEVLEQHDWCQKAYAKDKDDNPVISDDPTACKFCMYGAIAKAYGYSLDPLPLSGKIDKLHDTIRTRFEAAPLRWNDHPDRTKEEVISVLKELDI